MTAREDAIEAAWKAIPDDPEVEHMDIAAAVVDAAEPIIRADERERILSELEGPARESEAMYAHAEAVAARLVEVICRMDEEAEWYTPGSLEQARHQRDAARAEAERLRELAEHRCGRPLGDTSPLHPTQQPPTTGVPF